jgi:hypothetical protein
VGPSVYVSVVSSGPSGDGYKEEERPRRLSLNQRCYYLLHAKHGYWWNVESISICQWSSDSDGRSGVDGARTCIALLDFQLDCLYGWLGPVGKRSSAVDAEGVVTRGTGDGEAWGVVWCSRTMKREAGQACGRYTSNCNVTQSGAF